jgi:hypothetical protein
MGSIACSSEERCGLTLRAIGTTESELAVRVVGVAARLRREVDAEDLDRDRTLFVQVVQEGRHARSAGDRALRQVDGANTEDTVNAIEAGGRRRNTNRLRRHCQASECHLFHHKQRELATPLQW